MKKTKSQFGNGSELDPTHPTNRIHEIRERNKEDILKKYSKENIMRKVKQMKNNPKALANSQQSDYISQVPKIDLT